MIKTLSCPRCEGRDIREVRPGEAECTSLVLIGVVPTSLSGGPLPIPDEWPCGFRFPVDFATAPPLCGCGRFAEGACESCGKPICWLHSADSKTPLTCRECVARHERERRSRQTGERRSNRRRAEAAIAALPDAVRSDEFRILLADAVHSPKWPETATAFIERLVEAGAVALAKEKIVHVRFRKFRFLPAQVTELWQRPAWECLDDPTLKDSSETCRHWYLDGSGRIWAQERTWGHRDWSLRARLTGREWPPEGTFEVGEYSTSKPSAYVHGSPHLEKAFVMPTNQPIELTARGAGEAGRERFWIMAAGKPVRDITNHFGMDAHVPSMTLGALAAT